MSAAAALPPVRVSVSNRSNANNTEGAMKATTPDTVTQQLRGLAGRARRKVTPQMVLDARISVGLTQLESAGVMGCGERTWQQWEKGEREISQRDFEFFLLLTSCADARAALRKILKGR